jgi:hypothetical protein
MTERHRNGKHQMENQTETVNRTEVAERGPVYSWRPYWNDTQVCVSQNPPLIHEQWGKLMAKVDHLAAVEKDGVKFKVKAMFGEHGLMAKLAPALRELNLRLTIHKIEGSHIEVERGTAAFMKTTLRLCAADGSFVEMVGAGHGVDSQDKAGGKCLTYSVKGGLIYGLALNDAEMEDTDDSSEPIKGGPRKGKSGTFVLDHDEFKQMIDDAETEAELDEIKNQLKVEGTRNDALVLMPLVSAKRKEIKKAEAPNG